MGACLRVACCWQVSFEEMKAQIGARLVWFALDFNKDDKFTLEELHRYSNLMHTIMTRR